METVPKQPRAVVLDDGELADVRALLQELDTAVEDSSQADGRDAAGLSGAALVVASARRAPELPPCLTEERDRPLVIVVQDRDSRLLPEPPWADVVLRRPFHPSTLRVLVRRALYRGPERRRSERVEVGASVRFRAGLWRHRAILVEVSLRGCRLLSERAVKSGQRVTLLLPPEVTGDAALSVPGRVIRFGRDDAAEARGECIGIEFEPLSGEVWQGLSALIARHARGTPRAADEAEAPEAPADPRPEPASVAEECESAPDPDSCRRRAPRRAYSRRVIALGEAKARVLVGRDLSPGGMRADPAPHVSVGDELRLALHVRPGDEPLVVRAEVARDDGERGLVLLFRQVSPAATAYLERMLAALPVLTPSDGAETPTGHRVLAEIVENAQA